MSATKKAEELHHSCDFDVVKLLVSRWIAFLMLNWSLFCFCIWICFSIDATDEPLNGPRLGRLVNHGDLKQQRNARMKVLDTHPPCLCLFATRFISPGEEILYDYGIKVPWMLKVYIGLFFSKGNYLKQVRCTDNKKFAHFSSIYIIMAARCSADISFTRNVCRQNLGIVQSSSMKVMMRFYVCSPSVEGCWH